MLFLSNLSYSLKKKVPEATEENPRRGYDALVQPDFSSVSKAGFQTLTLGSPGTLLYRDMEDST